MAHDRMRPPPGSLRAQCLRGMASPTTHRVRPGLRAALEGEMPMSAAAFPAGLICPLDRPSRLQLSTQIQLGLPALDLTGCFLQLQSPSTEPETGLRTGPPRLEVPGTCAAEVCPASRALLQDRRDDLQRAAAEVQAVLHVDVKDALKQPRPVCQLTCAKPALHQQQQLAGSTSSNVCQEADVRCAASGSLAMATQARRRHRVDSTIGRLALQTC